jgi:cytosine/adenosine deaminase-related metal-dependent hydrolase
MASTLIHNVRIFDGEEVISQNGYVLFGDGVIKSIGTDSTEKLPDATIVIDGEVCKALKFNNISLFHTSSPNILI